MHLQKNLQPRAKRSSVLLVDEQGTSTTDKSEGAHFDPRKVVERVCGEVVPFKALVKKPRLRDEASRKESTVPSSDAIVSILDGGMQNNKAPANTVHGPSNISHAAHRALNESFAS